MSKGKRIKNDDGFLQKIADFLKFGLINWYDIIAPGEQTAAMKNAAPWIENSSS